jgi:hypothetical protein
MDSSTFIQSVNKQARTTAQRDTCIENLTDCTVQTQIQEAQIKSLKTEIVGIKRSRIKVGVGTFALGIILGLIL